MHQWCSAWFAIWIQFVCLFAVLKPLRLLHSMDSDMSHTCTIMGNLVKNFRCIGPKPQAQKAKGVEGVSDDVNSELEDESDEEAENEDKHREEIWARARGLKGPANSSSDEENSSSLGSDLDSEVDAQDSQDEVTSFPRLSFKLLLCLTKLNILNVSGLVLNFQNLWHSWMSQM